jgi:ribosomal-protein-serine acetyltransferase
MFTMEVDQDITLCLIEASFSEQYEALAKANYDHLKQWLAWPDFCQSADDFKEFAKRSLHDYADGKSLTCGLFYQGILVGNISFNKIDHNLKTVVMGYWLSADYQGKGIITRACQHLIQYAFTKLDMQKIQISAAKDNLASRAVCERLNMTLEGTITHAEKIGNRILDHAIYGLYK